MTDAVILRNLKLYAERAVVSAVHTGAWEFRLADYREQGDYVFHGDFSPWKGETFSTDYTFFGRTRFIPTAPAEGQTAFLELYIANGCEAFVSVDGKLFAGVNNIFGRNRIYLPPETYGRETSIEIEQFLSRQEYSSKAALPLSSCRWVVIDDEAEDFAHSMQLLWDVIRETPLDYRRDQLKNLLEDIIRRGDMGEDADDYRASVHALNARLREALSGFDDGSVLGEIDCVASTHIDVAWMWQYKETIRKTGRSALNQFRLMDRYPEFEFSLSQPSIYNYVKDTYPDIFAEIKRRVAAGQWQLIGPMWVESDLNLAGAETLVREFLYGHEFFLREFGKTSDMCWIPDSFGFPSNMPQIFKKCGMKYFYTTKVRWQAANDFPYNVFVWEGLDHSQLLATIPKTPAYYNGCIEPHQLMYASQQMQQKALHDKTLFVYGYGDGGGGPTEKMLQNYRKLKKYPGMPAVKLVRTDEYFSELEAKRDELPVWKGELCVETHEGTYTTIARNKRSNRIGEMALRRIDLLAAIANISGSSYAEITEKWKELLLLQFHDVLPGSSIDAVYEDTDRMYASLFEYAKAKQESLISDVFLPTADEDVLTVWNPNSFTADAYVSVPARFAGKAMCSGEHTANVVSDGVGGYRMRVDALSGFASRVYRVCDAVPEMPRVTLMEADGIILVKTPHFSFSIYEDGTLHDFTDHRDGFVYSDAKGLNRFTAYKDGPEREDAWNMDKEFRLRPIDMGWKYSLSIAEANGERAVIRSVSDNGRTVITQDITVYADIARVDFFTHVNWQEKHRVLQVSFPVTVEAPTASYEVAYGITKHPTHANTPAQKWRHEYVAHRFIDLSDDVRGAALLNDCKYGHNVIDSDMTITLLRSTDFPARFADIGEHDFAYAFLPHPGGLKAGKVAEQAYLFNSPLVVIEGVGSVPAPVTLSDDGMIVDCIKPAEDGDGIILRLYEPRGTSGSLMMRFPESVCVIETDPLEQSIADAVCSDSMNIRYTPFEFRTFRIKKQQLRC